MSETDDGTTWHGWVRFYVTCYWPSLVRWFWHETLPRQLAWWLPRKVAYLAFVRVYSIMGAVGPDYDPVCRLWEAGHGR